jgi:hypothetical protein
MEFRWIAGITLWTMLSGPVLIHWSMAVPRPRQEPPARVEQWSPPAWVEPNPETVIPVVFVNEDF